MLQLPGIPLLAHHNHGSITIANDIDPLGITHSDFKTKKTF